MKTTIALLFVALLAGCAAQVQQAPTERTEAAACQSGGGYCAALSGEEWERKFKHADTFRPHDAPRQR